MDIKKLCIEDFVLDGMPFIRGIEYKVSYNPIVGVLFIYDVWGRYYPISKQLLNDKFM